MMKNNNLNALISAGIVVLVAIVAVYVGYNFRSPDLAPSKDINEAPLVCPVVKGSSIDYPLDIGSIKRATTNNIGLMIKVISDSLENDCKSKCLSIDCSKDLELANLDATNQKTCQNIRGCAYDSKTEGPTCHGCGDIFCSVTKIGDLQQCYYPAVCYNPDGSIIPGCKGECIRLPVPSIKSEAECKFEPLPKATCYLNGIKCDGSGNRK